MLDDSDDCRPSTSASRLEWERKGELAAGCVLRSSRVQHMGI
jgi:hypothetical protein